MSTTFKGANISRDDVLRAFELFDDLYPATKDYADWLENDAYKYAIRYQGKLYPPKHILSQISGIPTTEFSGGDQTNRVFRQLGFEVGPK